MNGAARARGEVGEKVDFSRQCDYLVKTNQVSKRSSAFKKRQWPQFASFPAGHLTFPFLLLVLYWALKKISLHSSWKSMWKSECLLPVGVSPGQMESCWQGLPQPSVAVLVHLEGFWPCYSFHSICPAAPGPLWTHSGPFGSCQALFLADQWFL